MKSTADPKELLGRFWSELKDLKTGMLGLASSPHAQPMTAHFADSAGPIWFFARADSDLASKAAGSQSAAFHYASGGHDLFACVHGMLSPVKETEVASRFWSDEVGRWFPGGPDDPNLTMLRFEPERAHIWLPKEAFDPSSFELGQSSSKDVRAEAKL
jgi:general stress protein 26